MGIVQRRKSWVFPRPSGFYESQERLKKQVEGFFF